MEIFVARPGDAAEVAELAAATFPLACPPDEDPAQIAAHIAAELTPARFARDLATPTRTLLLARDDGRATGYLLLVAEPPPPAVAPMLTPGPSVEVSKCYVRAESHGCGVAQALMDAAVAATAGGHLWLGVSSVNERAIGFYRRNGFTEVGVKDFWLGSLLYHDPVLERSS